MSTVLPSSETHTDERTYRQRIRAWTLYDWANSAFATTILAAVLPVYYSVVAGATLPSDAQATAYWSLGLSFSLLIGAILSPILGTISDISRTKKRLLFTFTVIGVVPTGMLVLVERGDWLLASILFIVARVGFLGSYSFYDSLLPHVARPQDQDRVSAMGYAMGYLGGGLLLAINVVMIQMLPGTWGPRLSFLSVAVWWLLFSIPIFRRVPEPEAAGHLRPGERVVASSFRQLAETFRDARRYRELFKFLLAFLIYNDAIGTIIGMAAIYGAELGFGSVELILALLLVQFVGIPFSLMFGSLPSSAARRRPFYLAFVCYNLVMLPLAGVAASRLLPGDASGAPPAPFVSTESAVGEGSYAADAPAFVFEGGWTPGVVSAAQSGLEADRPVQTSSGGADAVTLRFNGLKVEVVYSSGPGLAQAAVELDGSPVTGEDGPLVIDGSGETARFGQRVVVSADAAGEHTLTLRASGPFALEEVHVLPAPRSSSLLTIIGLLLAVQAVGLAFAAVAQRWFVRLADTLNTKRAIVLSLVVYTVVAIWGFFLNSTAEFWFLAWMVAIVQGGSQALSRSMFASLSPARKSGEFFGLYGVMEKFSAVLGPLVFALAVALFGSSRPAIISLVLFFAVGSYLLLHVRVEEGQRVAREEDAKLAASGAD